MLFYLGTHEVHWLERTDAPLFISRVRLARRTRLPVAEGMWALDSGGFSELSKHGRWSVGPEQYANEVTEYQKAVGRMEWAAIQDWMCEPEMLEKVAVTEGAPLGDPDFVERRILLHQQRTVQSYLTLRALRVHIPWVPVLQGWELRHYLNHLEIYASRGIDLRNRPVVGIGSICRRQHTEEAEQIIKTIAVEGVQLHGFGFKVLGLRKVSRFLASSDSMAWSYNARKHPPMEGCTHKTCSNCIRWALRWRARLLSGIYERERTDELRERAEETGKRNILR